MFKVSPNAFAQHGSKPCWSYCIVFPCMLEKKRSQKLWRCNHKVLVRGRGGTLWYVLGCGHIIPIAIDEMGKTAKPKQHMVQRTSGGKKT